MRELEEMELAVVARLEYPADEMARRRWLNTLRTAVAVGSLVARTERRERPGAMVRRDWLNLPPLQNPPVITVCHFIARDAYRQWRGAHPPPPAAGAALIRDWLEPAPAEEPPRQASIPRREIAAQLKAGASMATINRETGAPIKQIRRIRDAAGIPKATPGPKPKAE